MDWNWQVIFDSIPDLLNGAVLTVQLVVISGIIGLFFGLVLAQLRLSKNWLVQILPLYLFLPWHAAAGTDIFDLLWSRTV